MGRAAGKAAVKALNRAGQQTGQGSGQGRAAGTTTDRCSVASAGDAECLKLQFTGCLAVESSLTRKI